MSYGFYSTSSFPFQPSKSLERKTLLWKLYGDNVYSYTEVSKNILIILHILIHSFVPPSMICKDPILSSVLAQMQLYKVKEQIMDASFIGPHHHKMQYMAYCWQSVLGSWL